MARFESILDSIRKPATLLPLLLLAALALVPFAASLADQPFYVVFFARIMIYAIAASALNVALGLGGLVSLGHALFLGLGAYSVAIPAYHGIDNGWVHLAVCVASCGAVGLLTGAISLRTTGIGFIMITLAFAQMGYFVFVSLKQYGGDDGTPVNATSRFFGYDLGQPATAYAVAFALLCVVLWWTARLRVAPFGMVLRGARQNARRINAVGFRAQRYQLAAYVVSAVLCGLAGMLLANLTAFASPATLSWIVSGDLIVMIVLGGLGTVFGPLLGAVAFMGAEELLKMVTEFWPAVFGLVIFVVALLRTVGLAGLLEKLAPRTPAPPSGPSASPGPAAPGAPAARILGEHA
ncbi:branched-chain amino acid ABC transporter permease [Pseudoduganella sp. LjRoot289]|uniref:branched-chain amino acid ABC transporter permease n=1 Tax=Pseudoduganella sp. LjRoot289 TaxID=3342314 RepID=UPI003ED1282A